MLVKMSMDVPVVFFFFWGGEVFRFPPFSQHLVLAIFFLAASALFLSGSNLREMKSWDIHETDQVVQIVPQTNSTRIASDMWTPWKNHEHDSCYLQCFTDLKVIDLSRHTHKHIISVIIVHIDTRQEYAFTTIINMCFANLWHRLVEVFAIVRVINAFKNMAPWKNKYETLWNDHHGPWMSLTWKCCWQDSSKLLLESSVQFVHPRPLCRNHVMVQLTPCFPFPTSNCKVPTWWITTFINGLNANPGTIWLKGKNRWSHPSRNYCFWLWMALARNALIQACGGISLLPRMSSKSFFCASDKQVLASHRQL